jgi:hypothetical protein
MFGYRAAEMDGHDLEAIIPEKLRDRHNEGYRRVMATGVSRYATTTCRSRKTAAASPGFTITRIKDDQAWSGAAQSGTLPPAALDQERKRHGVEGSGSNQFLPRTSPFLN